VIDVSEYENCELCEWRCGVNRLNGEPGVCRIGAPEVAASMLHPAPPESYTIFMAGCNFRCLHCQNYDIAHYPDTGAPIEGPRDPADLAREGVEAMSSLSGRLMGADRLFFSGGEPTCSLPFVEEVVQHARKINSATKVNFDTNGFATEESFQRILRLATSVTFDIRAVSDQVHRAETGAPAAPVLRNAEKMAENADRLWEFRVLVVPQINAKEIEGICQFIAKLDKKLPVAFLAFRPNFVLDRHPGATIALMQMAVEIARDCGLKNAEWHGHPGIAGHPPTESNLSYRTEGARIAGGYAAGKGCETHPRNCGECELCHQCPVKHHRPYRRT
jgi:pyruvate formate lyase activating enzyme